MQPEAVITANAPAPVGPYNQAVKAGGVLYCSGQIALDPVSGSMVGDGDVEAETRQVLSNLALYGNTSAATIPLMLDEAVKDGRVQPGHLLASSGFGAGLSWGAALLRWQGPTD